jgi:hypothetical protein
MTAYPSECAKAVPVLMPQRAAGTKRELHQF